MTGILEKVVSALKTDNRKLKSSFYTEHILSPSDIEVRVDGIGVLELPLSTKKVQELIAVSSKAKFGLRDQTILDEEVRSTQEIPLDKLKINFPKNKLQAILQKTRKELGLGEHVELVPHLHNMLIYSAGQFFKKHQDSEKMDGMVATLVITLPSSHIGGNLIVEHDDEKYTFSSENIEGTDVKCFAFYADCHHEVTKVTQGYRVALTYNLIVESKGEEKAQTNAELTKNVAAYFSEFENSEEEDPTKLVYFLEHSYSEHGLRWDLLKGADYKNGSAFFAAAQELGLTPHLALVEIHESWDAHEDVDEEEDPELGDLIEDNITLSYWVDATNKETNFGDCTLRDKEICWTKDTDEFKPYETEREGYMGNYGNTIDYWYRRAAIVLWKKDQDTRMRFKLDTDGALEDLVALTKTPGREQEILDLIAMGSKYVYGSQQYYHEQRSSIFALLVPIALYIKDAQIAHALLNQFSLQELSNDMFVQHIVALQKTYDTDWCVALLELWKQKTNSYRGDRLIIEKIEALTQQLLKAHCNVRIIEYILNYQVKSIVNNDAYRETERPATRTKEMPKRIDTLRDTILGCIATPTTASLNELIQHLMTSPTIYSEIDLAQLYFSFDRKTLSQAANLYFNQLHDFLTTTIDQKCQVGIPSPDDWTIKAKLSCTCQNCKIVTYFLRASDERTRVWPLVEAGRKHVMQALNGLELPVDLSVEAKGSPYKLIMTKNDSLHTNAQKKLDQLLAYRKKLQSINSVV